MTTEREHPEVDTEVTVAWGQYGGRNGRVVRYERGGGAVGNVYPVVRLRPWGRADAREVRVAVVTAEHLTTIHVDGHVTCACGETSHRFGTDANARRWIKDHFSRIGLPL